MFINDQVAQFEEIYRNLIRGFPPSIKCEQCHGLFDESNGMTTYKCGHSYHKECPVIGQKIKSKTYSNEFIQ